MEETGREDLSDMESVWRRRGKTERSIIVRSLSKLYGLFIVILALVIACAHIISGTEVSAMIPMVYYAIVYSISLAYLIYIHVYIKRSRTQTRPTIDRTVYAVTMQGSKSIPDEPSEPKPGGHSSENSTLRGRHTDSGNEDTLNKSYISVAREESTMISHFSSRSALYLQANVDYPNFFLRVGAIFFGAGDMVYHGLEIGKIAADTLTCGSDLDIARILASILHFLFVFYQVYFIFKHSKIAIKSHKRFVRFALMHLQAANICACVMALMEETIRSSTGDWLHGGKENSNHDKGDTLASYCANLTSVANIFERASPYLYPCIIQYSIIGVAAMGNIYRHIGPPADGRGRALNISRIESEKADDTTEVESGYMCHQSYRGLFLGIIILIATVIAFILFSVFDINDKQRFLARTVYVVTELAVLFLTFCATIAAIVRIRRLPFDPYRLPTRKIDCSLLIVCTVAVYGLDGFRAMVALHEGFTWICLLSSIRPFLSSIQATLQIILIFNGIKRYTHTHSMLFQKPGREYVVFILLTNFALWAMYMFEAKTTYGDEDVYMFFNHDAWLLVVNLVSPLVVFFRFHSATCLYEIWKTSYRLEKSAEGFVAMNMIG